MGMNIKEYNGVSLQKEDLLCAVVRVRLCKSVARIRLVKTEKT
jgi:hypothetical protein